MELSVLKEFLPLPVIVSIVTVICLVYLLGQIVTVIEDNIELQKGKQIKLFDHKKIWLSFPCCVLCSVTMAIAGFIEWKELLFYIFVVMGGSTFFYESIVKKIGKKSDVEKDS